MLTRSKTWLVVVVALAGSAASAWAESQAEIASRENDEGRDLMYASKYDEATAKFRDAVARVPEAKYFFNLCTSLYQEGKYGESLTACNSAEKNNSDDKLKDKIEKMSGRIKEEAKKQGLDLQPVGGGGGETNTNPVDPNHPVDPNQPPVDPNHPVEPINPNAPQPPGPVQYRPVQGRPPPNQQLFAAVKPDHNYTWTLGVDVYGGGGQIGASNFYGSSSFGVRAKGDYLFNRPSRIGTQVYLQYTTIGQGSDQMGLGVSALDIIDAGAALYKHFCLRGQEHVCLTPLVGLQLALMSPNQTMDTAGNQLFNYSAIGARGELNVAYAFGPRMENVLSLMVGFNAYSKVLGEPSDGSPSSAQLGLDTGGAFGYFGVGYTYRFNTPLGSSPFVTLE